MFRRGENGRRLLGQQIIQSFAVFRKSYGTRPGQLFRRPIAIEDADTADPVLTGADDILIPVTDHDRVCRGGAGEI